MWEKILGYIETYGLKVVIAIVMLLAGIIVIKIVLSLMKKILFKTKLEKATAKFLTTVSKIGLWVLLIMIICQYVGIPMTGIVAVISAAGLAMSLALQGSLSNLANGVVIISTKPFKEGDYVEIGNEEGTVVEIRMMHTILKTSDNKEVSIPNQTVVNSEIVNYSRYKTRKLLIEFPINYATDIPKVKDLLYNIMINNDMVLLEPAPAVQLFKLADSSISMRIACWCATDNYWDLKFELMEQVFNEFKKESIDIPFNQMEVRMRDDIVTLPYNNQPIKKRSENAVNAISETDEVSLSDYIKKKINSTKNLKLKKTKKTKTNKSNSNTDKK